jgi:hypothetical protein
LVVAAFPGSTLALARVPLSTDRVVDTFAARLVAEEGRAREGSVTRLWGNLGAERAQLAVLGTEGVGLELGRLGSLGTAVYFAEGRLRRAQPALRAEPLTEAATALGDAPLRGFAPGPFEGEWGAGAGGLLRAATAIGAALRPRELVPQSGVWMTLVLTGAWGADASAAAERLGAAFRVLANDPLGRLLGIDNPLDGPHVSGAPDVLRLDVVLDPIAVGRGLHAATDATLAEILGD